jgi:hypothetical protein
MAIHSSKFLRRLDHLLDEMNWKDAVVINIDIVFITLLVTHFWPELAQAHRAWYVVAVLSSEIYLYQRLNKRGKSPSSEKSKKIKKSDPIKE